MTAYPWPLSDANIVIFFKNRVKSVFFEKCVIVQILSQTPYNEKFLANY